MDLREHVPHSTDARMQFDASLECKRLIIVYYYTGFIAFVSLV